MCCAPGEEGAGDGGSGGYGSAEKSSDAGRDLIAVCDAERSCARVKEVPDPPIEVCGELPMDDGPDAGCGDTSRRFVFSPSTRTRADRSASFSRFSSFSSSSASARSFRSVATILFACCINIVQHGEEQEIAKLWMNEKNGDHSIKKKGHGD